MTTTKKTDAPLAPAAWWQDELTRREANRRVLAGGALVAGVAAIGATSAGCTSNSEPTESNSLDLQRASGWNVGFDTESITVPDATTSDSLGGEGWRGFLTPTRLIEATQPAAETWRSHESPALIQALGQASLASAMTPMHNTAMDAAYGRGLALGELIDASENPQETLIVIDMPGEEAVSAAAGMAKVIEPVFWFDNWPHPRGVVDSERPLAALLYYAAELDAARSTRPEQHARALVFDANRLANYTDASADFDNRYMADLPDAAQLQAYGITKVLYVRPSQRDQDLDDVNEPLAALSGAGISVQMVTMDAFQLAEGKDSEGESAYRYGGSERTHTHFYSHFPLFLFLASPRYSGWSRSSVPPRNVRPSSWQPRPRPTMFSSATKGGAAGVGRTRPTGFGRVSYQAGRGGRVSGVRSGSYARTSGAAATSG
jgi:hypothetical protein